MRLRNFERSLISAIYHRSMLMHHTGNVLLAQMRTLYTFFTHMFQGFTVSLMIMVGEYIHSLQDTNNKKVSAGNLEKNKIVTNEDQDNLRKNIFPAHSHI